MSIEAWRRSYGTDNDQLRSYVGRSAAETRGLERGTRFFWGLFNIGREDANVWGLVGVFLVALLAIFRGVWLATRGGGTVIAADSVGDVPVAPSDQPPEDVVAPSDPVAGDVPQPSEVATADVVEPVDQGPVSIPEPLDQASEVVADPSAEDQIAAVEPTEVGTALPIDEAAKLIADAAGTYWISESSAALSFGPRRNIFDTTAEIVGLKPIWVVECPWVFDGDRGRWLPVWLSGLRCQTRDSNVGGIAVIRT